MIINEREKPWSTRKSERTCKTPGITLNKIKWFGRLVQLNRIMCSFVFLSVKEILVIGKEKKIMKKIRDDPEEEELTQDYKV